MALLMVPYVYHSAQNCSLRRPGCQERKVENCWEAAVVDIWRGDSLPDTQFISKSSYWCCQNFYFIRSSEKYGIDSQTLHGLGLRYTATAAGLCGSSRHHPSLNRFISVGCLSFGTPGTFSFATRLSQPVQSVASVPSMASGCSTWASPFGRSIYIQHSVKNRCGRENLCTKQQNNEGSLVIFRGIATTSIPTRFPHLF